MITHPSGHARLWARCRRLRTRLGLAVILCPWGLVIAVNGVSLRFDWHVAPMASHTPSHARQIVLSDATAAFARWIVTAYDADATALIARPRITKAESARIRCPERRAPRDEMPRFDLSGS